MLTMVSGALLAAAGCGESGGDATECVPRCGAGQACYQGECVPAGSVPNECTPACDADERCQPDGSCTPISRNLLSCAELLSCASSCSDQACVDACRDEAGYFAKATYDTLAECEAAYCPDGDQQCLLDKCENQLKDCAGVLVSECSGVGPEGGCQGNTLLTCVGGQVQQTDCSQGAPGCFCLFDQATERFGCSCEGGGGVCNPPCPPGQGCMNGQCVLIGDESCQPQCQPGFVCVQGGCVPAGTEDCPADLPEGASRCEQDVYQSCAGGKLSEQDCSAIGCTCGFDPSAPGGVTCCPGQDF